MGSIHLILQTLCMFSLFVFETLMVLNLTNYSSKEFLIVYASVFGFTLLVSILKRTGSLVNSLFILVLGVIGNAILFKNYHQIRQETLNFHVLMASLLFQISMNTFSRINFRRSKVNQENQDGMLDQYVEQYNHGSNVLLA